MFLIVHSVPISVKLANILIHHVYLVKVLTESLIIKINQTHASIINSFNMI